MPRFFASASSSCWLDSSMARESSEGIRPTRMTFVCARTIAGIAKRAPAAATDPVITFRREMFMSSSQMIRWSLTLPVNARA
jgi:hypothetical protein